MHPMLTIAVKAARRAGSVINRAARDLDGLSVERKSRNDFVTDTDRNAERAIIDVLARAYPDHAILAEESGHSGGGAGKSEYTWIIDPIDGTTNFIHGFPQYAVSIALQHKRIVTQAVIYAPSSDELFIASRGRGAFLNDRRLRVSKRTAMRDALIGTGFSHRDFTRLDGYMQMLREVTTKCAGVRRAGSAALDLAFVAAGRLDGFWELGLSPWDMAAGSLLIQEAGGLVADLDGESDFLETGRIVGGNPKIFAQLLQTVAPHARA